MFQYCLESVMESSADGFQRCLGAILRENKGYAPGDGNGPTNHGITQAVYSVWREEQSLPDKDVWQISFGEVESIYLTECWLPSHAGDCSSPLDLFVFNAATESGARWAVKTLQQCLGLPRNGRFCQRTRAAVKSCDGSAVALRYLEARIVYYQDLCKKDLHRSAHLAHKLAKLEELLAALRHLAERGKEIGASRDPSRTSPAGVLASR